MEHDIVLTCRDGSERHFRIYGRSTPSVGEIVTLPVDGQLIKGRIGEGHGDASVEHIDVIEFEGV